MFKLAFNEPCACGKCNVKNHRFVCGALRCNFFREGGDWFLYMHWKKCWWRFSNAGFIKGVA